MPYWVSQRYLRCDICKWGIDLFNIFLESGCGHLVHRSCMEDYLEATPDFNDRDEVMCPIEECHNLMPTDIGRLRTISFRRGEHSDVPLQQIIATYTDGDECESDTVDIVEQPGIYCIQERPERDNARAGSEGRSVDVESADGEGNNRDEQESGDGDSDGRVSTFAHGPVHSSGYPSDALAKWFAEFHPEELNKDVIEKTEEH